MVGFKELIVAYEPSLEFAEQFLKHNFLFKRCPISSKLKLFNLLQSSAWFTGTLALYTRGQFEKRTSVINGISSKYTTAVLHACARSCAENKNIDLNYLSR